MAGPLNKNYFTTTRRNTANTVGERYQVDSAGNVILIPPLSNQKGVPGDNERREYNEMYGPGHREVNVRDVNGVDTVSASNFKPNATGANYAIFDDSQGYRTIGPLGLLENIIDPQAEKIRDANYQNPNTDNIVSMGYGNGEVDPRLASAAGYSKRIEDTAGDFNLIEGRGHDAYGRFGVIGDFGGKIGNAIGVTDYGGDAARRMASYKEAYPNTVGKTYTPTEYQASILPGGGEVIMAPGNNVTSTLGTNVVLENYIPQSIVSRNEGGYDETNGPNINANAYGANKAGITSNPHVQQGNGGSQAEGSGGK